jgi:hypothetical protein
MHRRHIGMEAADAAVDPEAEGAARGSRAQAIW